MIGALQGTIGSQQTEGIDSSGFRGTDGLFMEEELGSGRHARSLHKAGTLRSVRAIVAQQRRQCIGLGIEGEASHRTYTKQVCASMCTPTKTRIYEARGASQPATMQACMQRIYMCICEVDK